MKAGQRKSKRDLNPKSKAGLRRLQLLELMFDELREHRRNQDCARAVVGSAWVDHDLIFTTPFGKLLHPFSDWEEWTSSNASVRWW